MKLTEEQFRAEYLARPGLIPVELDASEGTALWVDLGDFHCFEGSFRRSLAAYTALRAGARQPSEPWRCTSSLEFLRSAPNASECLSPSAFILHAGRCGSTLLAKVLARSAEHLVFGEGGPHNQIWPVIAGSSDPPAALLRNLLLHTGRRRLASHRAHIVKFTSWNIAQFERIRAAFPDVPALFIFRYPAEILASYRRKMPGWVGVNMDAGTTWPTPESAVADFFRHALRAGGELQYLDYADLTPLMLPAILRIFHLDPPQRDLEYMQAEFRWDSKSNRTWTARPVPEGAPPVPSELLDLYRELSLRKVKA
jgi:hypothetical protein